jgi:hypothetical protein
VIAVTVHVHCLFQKRETFVSAPPQAIAATLPRWGDAYRRPDGKGAISSRGRIACSVGSRRSAARASYWRVILRLATAD